MTLPFGDNMPRNSVYLLALFKEDLKNKLTEEALAAIRPKVEERVREVVAELSVQIHQHYDELKQQIVVEFSQRGVDNK